MNLSAIFINCLSLVVTSGLKAQEISNTGSFISVKPGTFILSNDLENSSGTITNNGTLNLSRNLTNSAIIGGNGFYNLRGNWNNYGTFNPGTSLVTFGGTLANQFINITSTSETFYNLTLDNPLELTQISPPGGSLIINNNLYIVKGILRLDASTSLLNVDGLATVAGSLIFDNNTSPQTTVIKGDLTGPGSIDISKGGMNHKLYLAGAINQIGAFNAGAGLSLVEYNGSGPTQTVFPADYRYLTISNAGIKTLQGNSKVGIDLYVNGGVFDLGIIPTSLEVTGTSNITGTMRFNGATIKTVNLLGNLLGTGAIDMSGDNLAHILNLSGSLNSIGAYSSGNTSTVVYKLNGNQTVFASNDYRNLSVTGTDTKTLLGDVNTKGTLLMAGGNVDADSYILEVSNPALTAINRTSGTVIGRLKRAIGTTTGEYLYPVGSSLTYNPAKITFHDLTAGSLTAQYKQEDIGTNGLPLADDDNEIYDRYLTGYWSLSATSPMSTGSFSVKLDFNGFTGIDASASIIKRTNGGDLELDGEHGGIAGSEISRNILTHGIATTSTDLAIGKGRPKITEQPANKAVCDSTDAFFKVKAKGRVSLSYQWEVSTDNGISYNAISDGFISAITEYGGTGSNLLEIRAATYSMNGYLYRCVVTDGQGHPNISSAALLTVNKIPLATATVPSPECPGIAFEDIFLGTSNGVTGTTFAWSRTNPAGIVTTLPLSGPADGDRITGIFNNTSDAPVSIVFTIIPTGPGTTFCVGHPIYRTVTVNPVPKVYSVPANSTQCDSTETDIRLTSPSTFTSGVITFRYTVTASDISGFTTPVSGLPDEHHITDKLINHSNTYKVVTYRIVPVSPTGCADGMAINTKVTVNPTPKAESLNNVPAICYDGRNQIILTTPTTMTTGSVVFDFSVSSSGGGVVTGDMTSGNDVVPGYTIARTYRNSSHDLQSVYFKITPVNNSVCDPGPPVVSEVKVHAIPIWNILQVVPLTCDGSIGRGALRSELSTGADPYHIVWNGPDNYHREDVTDIDNLISGAYYCAVTDNLGCAGTFNSYLFPKYAEPDIYPVPKAGGYNLSCIGSTDGQIRVSVADGLTEPYNFSLVKDNSEVIGTGVFTVLDDYRYFSGLGAGIYTLIITDRNGCIRSKQVTLVPPPEMAVTFGKREYQGSYNISCRGYNDGEVWVQSVTGGRGSYTYRWFTTDGSIPGPVNSDRIDNITAGRYYLEVSDALSCKKVFPVDITQPDGMSLAGSQVSLSRDGAFNVSCNGGDDGSISISIEGGSGSYTFNWTGPDGYTSSQKDISGLKAGSYTCTVTDLNGCVLMPVPSYTLTQPPPVQVAVITSVSSDGAFQINCFGGAGSINTTVTGGSANPYEYTWTTLNGSGIIQSTPNQQSLTAGLYKLEVKDYNGCIVAKDIEMNQPEDLALSFLPKHITCEVPGFSNGAIDLTVEGGAGTITYLWNNGARTQDVSGLTAGEYNVTATYNNTCVKTGSEKINLPPALTYSAALSNFNSYEVSCFGLSNGEIHITPTSGKAPYKYSWTGPDGFVSNSPDISGLKAGTYNLQMADSNLCTAHESIRLREPGEVEARFVLSQSIAGGFNLNCAGDSAGSITVNPHNTVNNVNYLWSDGYSGRYRTGLKAGIYTVVITDDNNCQAVGTASITQPDSIKLAYEIKQPFCPDEPDGEITLSISGGVEDYKIKWSDNSTGNVLTNIGTGEYKVIVEDINRCLVRDSIRLLPQNEACLVIPNMISPNGDLINDYWNIGRKELYPQLEVKIFNRWGELVWKSAKGYPDPWDGRSNGSMLPIDSYHYIIDLNDGKKPVIGNVTIVK